MCHEQTRTYDRRGSRGRRAFRRAACEHAATPAFPRVANPPIRSPRPSGALFGRQRSRPCSFRQQACAPAFGTGWVTRQPIPHHRAGRLGRHHGPARLERFWAMDVETRRSHPGRQEDPAEPGTCDPYPGAGEGTGSACPRPAQQAAKAAAGPRHPIGTLAGRMTSPSRRYGRPWTRQTL